MNYVLIPTLNNLELTKQCVESVQAQDVPVKICIVDNGSTDGTAEWAQSKRYLWSSFNHNAGVSVAWNIGLEMLFEDFGKNHVLVINNDTVLPPWIYRRLLSYGLPFVTGVAVDKMPNEEPVFDPTDINTHPDFSCFLITRSVWKTVGRFNIDMMIYCSDCDYHIRAHRLGVKLYKTNSPYFHVNSQTLKRADESQRRFIERQAHVDRMVFHSIYGCLPGSAEYENLFK